jgi:hypothetical protein
MREDTIKGWPGFWIRADADGFTMRYPLGRSRFRWEDVDGDFVATRSAVGFRLVPSARTSAAPRFAFGFQRGVTGFDAVIQASSYRTSPESLREWITDRRASALNGHS